MCSVFTKSPFASKKNKISSCFARFLAIIFSFLKDSFAYLRVCILINLSYTGNLKSQTNSVGNKQ